MGYRYQFDKQRCWYLTGCNQANTETCVSTCVRFMEVDYMMYMSNLPKNKQYPVKLFASVEDLDAFTRLKEIGDNIVDYVDNGNNLCIYSVDFGNGKTSWAIRLLLKYFNLKWVCNGFKRRGVFIHVPTFINRVKRSISHKDGYFESLTQDLAETDLVVWDDIAATKLSDYDHALLLTYIDQRNLNGKSNIYTGNLEYDGVVNALGNRLASRVWNGSEKIQFVGHDRRGVL